MAGRTRDYHEKREAGLDRMSINALKRFIIKAKAIGYAAGGEQVARKESDTSKSTKYKEGDYKFHDNWFGGEPFGGREIVHYKDKPLWMMVYYGSDRGTEDIIPTLLKALGNPDEELPVRGPKKLKHGLFVYTSSWEGDLKNFCGQEFISYKGKEVYSAIFAGGLVDQREG